MINILNITNSQVLLRRIMCYCGLRLLAVSKSQYTTNGSKEVDGRIKYGPEPETRSSSLISLQVLGKSK